MKRILLLLLLTPFVACVGKKSVERAESQNDSLRLVVAEKDSAINDIFLSMNAIAENLNAIKLRENIINRSMDGGEIDMETSTQISRDIEAINQLLIDNRATIEKLQRTSSQLQSANAKISGLEKLIEQLNLQIENKDQEIVVLKNTVATMQARVDRLTGQVDNLNTMLGELADDNTSLEGEVKARTDILNTAYYIIGPERELMAKDIIYKKGFIGRTLHINENRSLESFTKVDIRDFDALIIGGKKATLVSSHPADSYRFEANADGTFDMLHITDKTRFWEYSKVLIVSYK